MKIINLKINNFRSLVDFAVEEFNSTTIFYGENNAGKSNVLKALEIIFQRKTLYENNEFTSLKNFYEGFIPKFSYNFYNNNEDLQIEFEVVVEIKKSELVIQNAINRLFSKWPKSLIFKFSGKIFSSVIGEDIAEMQTNQIMVNDIVVFKSDSDEIKIFETLLAEENKNASELSEAFAHFIDIFNDCVYIIGRNRMTQSSDFSTELIDNFSAEYFINSIYSLSLDEKKYSIFEQINSVFDEYPFSFGTISFAKIENKIELMIKKDGIRLPIRHLGSGVEQILFILTSIIYTKRKIVCIEELEQNLSPKMQNLALRKLQSMIGKYLDQIILSSHSSVFSKVKLSDSIYLIEKVDSKTKVVERLKEKFGKKIKDHFIDAAPPADTYTKDEQEKNNEEIKRLTEERFKM